MVKTVLGVIALALAVLMMGPMLLMSGLDPAPRGADEQMSWLAMTAIFAVPGSVLMLVGALLVGRRWWGDAVGWTLVVAAAYGLAVFAMMWSFLSSPESAELMAATDPEASDLLDPGSMSWVRPVAIGAGMLIMGVPLALRRFKERWSLVLLTGGSQPATQRADSAAGRPRAVTVFAWAVILFGLIGLGAWALLVGGPGTGQLDAVERIWGIPKGLQFGSAIAGCLVMLVGGVGLLRGSDWARWTIAGFFVFSSGLSAVLYRSVLFVLPGLLWTAAAVVTLFVLPASRRFFNVVP
jgi:hypothetical protein